MFVITWLEESFSINKDINVKESLSVGTVYFAYKEACAAIGCKPITEKKINLIIRGYFTDIRSHYHRLPSGARVTLHEYLTFKQLAHVSKESSHLSLSPDFVKNAASPQWTVTLNDDANVTAARTTDTFINDNPVTKKIIFDHDSPNWRLVINDKLINLEDLHISDKYSQSERSLNAIFKIVDNLCICIGIEQPKTLKKLVFRTLDRFREGTGKNRWRLRSGMCPQVVDFSRSSSTCVLCSQYRVRVAPQPEPSDETPELINKLFPNIPEPMKKLLLDQSKNCNIEYSTQNRWCDEVKRICLTMWTSSKIDYELLHSSGLFVLPSPALLYKIKKKMADPPTNTSPKWRRPSDVMKVRKVRKKLATTHQPKAKNKSREPKTSESQNAGKRSNPFSCPPKRKVQTSDEDADGGGSIDGAIGSDLFSMLNKRPRLDIQESSADKNPSVTTDTSVNSLPETLFSNTSRNTVTKETNEAEKLVYNKDMICDWSLKMKIRFMSPELFSWCHPLKTNEECDGLYSFVRRAQYQANTCSRKPEFQKACMYWIHPNLPWCKLFPRINADSALGKQTGLLLEDHVLKALYDDWTESFTSAFHLLRSCHSPYFYMLTHQLNVLFRAPGVGGLNKMNAIVTPTTRGFREALTEEGIEFTMPLHDTTKTDNEDDSESNSPVQNIERVDYENDLDPELIEDDDLLATDSGASSWLESMGLDKSSYPSLDPNKVKLQRESYRAIDNRPESMVLVQGPSTQALYNYLLNYKSCIAHSGSQAGVPPTILSPTAFKGATLKSLQVKQGTIRQQCQDGTMVSHQTLEVSGPILPHTTLALCSLFKQTQCSDFSGVFNVHDHSTAFNGTPSPQNAKNSRNNWGLPMDMEEVLFRSNNLGKLAVREIVCTADGYHWNT